MLTLSSHMHVIEFIGMPRAGKTTQINILKKSLKKQGLRVAVLTDRERATSLSTPPTDGHAYTLVFFAAVIEAYHRHKDTADVLLIDRGIYDAAVWADVRRAFKEITTNEQAALKAVFERHKKIITSIIYFAHPVHDSLKRHKNTAHEAVDDVVMNKTWLTVLSRAYAKQSFPKKKTLFLNGNETKEAIAMRIAAFTNQLIKT